MPQDSLLPDEERYTGLSVTVREGLTPSGRTWIWEVRRAGADGVYRLVWTARWDGVMLDLTGTLAQQALEAFFFGERRDLARQCGVVHRAAGAHRKAHESARF